MTAGFDTIASSPQVTIENILEEACRDAKDVRPQTTAGSTEQLGRSSACIRKAWAVLNKWALEIIGQRGTVDVPNFMRTGWQRFRSASGEMRLRPVFILSEGFCRAHGLPYKRMLRPPLFQKKAEVVNHTKLAIRYTSYMTKGMIYGALREIVRGIGDAMSRGIQVSVAMSFGILEAKNRKFRFVFDAAALGETEPAPRSLTPNPDAGNSRGRGEGSRLSTSRSAHSDWNSSDGYECRGHPSSSSSPASPNCGACRASASEDVGLKDRSSSIEDEDEVERERAREVKAEWGRKRGSRRKSEAHEKVLEYAFRDHVTALEGQAEDDQTLATRRRDMRRVEENRMAHERTKKQREMHDLLTFVQGQIHELEARRASELEDTRGVRQLTFSARRDRARRAHECFEGKAWRAPDWGPRRARAQNLSREELLTSLQRQIRDREEEARRKSRTRLTEEQAAIAKLDREFDVKEEVKKGIKEEALQDLKRSWEKHVHLKRMNSLAKAGPAAVREYALSQKLIDDNEEQSGRQQALADGTGFGGGYRGRAGWIEPGPTSITGPAKLYVKGLCRYRRPDRPGRGSDNGDEQDGSVWGGSHCGGSRRFGRGNRGSSRPHR